MLLSLQQESWKAAGSARPYGSHFNVTRYGATSRLALGWERSAPRLELPMTKTQKKAKEDAMRARLGAWLDTHIGGYFSNPNIKQSGTLGQSLAMSMDYLLPDAYLEFLSRPRG